MAMNDLGGGCILFGGAWIVKNIIIALYGPRREVVNPTSITSTTFFDEIKGIGRGGMDKHVGNNTFADSMVGIPFSAFKTSDDSLAALLIETPVAC